MQVMVHRSIQKIQLYRRASLPHNQIFQQLATSPFSLYKPYHIFLSSPFTSFNYTSLLSAMASSSSSSTKLFATVLVLYLLASLSFTEACGSCKPPKPKPKPKPKPCPTPVVPEKCPLDTLKLGVCANILGLVNVVVGSPATSDCCPLLAGLADLEAALCLCTAIKANVLGINLNVPVSLSLILSACQKSVPPGFQCPY